MYRRNEEQKEMATVCEMLVDDIFKEYDKKELHDVAFISKCSFTCGFLYATFGDCDKYEFMEESMKFLIDTYDSVGCASNEKE